MTDQGDGDPSANCGQSQPENGMTLDHVGIATTDADDLADLYVDLLGCNRVHEESFDGMWIVFLEIADGSYFELLEPREGGTIAAYLEDHGPGIHHIAFRIQAIEAALDRARNLGIDLIDETPRDGAWGHNVAFLHPGTTGGVLVEFVEH